MKVYVFESRLEGHRNGYLNYFKSLGPDTESLIGFSFFSCMKLLFAKNVIFSTADDYFLRYMIFCFLRFFLRKKTIGVLIRAEYALNPIMFKHKIKYFLLKIQLTLNAGNSVSIMPFYVEPELESLLSNWIYDPAFFSGNAVTLTSENSETRIYEVVGEHEDKTLYLFLGAMSIKRGFLDYLDFVKGLKCGANKNSFVSVAAGKNLSGYDEISFKHLEHYYLYIFPLVVSEEAFDYLLKKSDVVWCGFSESYDQFSGIFCNSFKLEKKVVVRRNSRLQKFLKVHDCPVIETRLDTSYVMYDCVSGVKQTKVFKFQNKEKIFCYL